MPSSSLLIVYPHFTLYYLPMPQWVVDLEFPVSFIALRSRIKNPCHLFPLRLITFLFPCLPCLLCFLILPSRSQPVTRLRVKPRPPLNSFSLLLFVLWLLDFVFSSSSRASSFVRMFSGDVIAQSTGFLVLSGVLLGQRLFKVQY